MNNHITARITDIVQIAGRQSSVLSADVRLSNIRLSQIIQPDTSSSIVFILYRVNHRK
ncbi:hypothetical protein QUF95_24210 [Paenibacillus silvae]|uniref:hypothetical protein n=1 Tax=Paenibacillus silvae TaxID=1325358 RepID=UPI0016425297|nr:MULTISPECIES: hypothetical protein [Paenibacillus]MDM5280476.1 hypothetical protein [Paenibacillus silvae]